MALCLENDGKITPNSVMDCGMGEVTLKQVRVPASVSFARTEWEKGFLIFFFFFDVAKEVVVAVIGNVSEEAGEKNL